MEALPHLLGFTPSVSLYSFNLKKVHLEGSDEMFYKECSICGVCTDDGAVKDGNVICHDCLDGEENAPSVVRG